MDGAFLYVLCAVVCAGIALALLIAVPLLYAGALLFLTALFLVGAMILRAPKLLLVAVAFAALAFGIVRTNIFLDGEAQNNLKSFSGSAVVEGAVVNDPEQSGSYIHANIAVASVNNVSARGTVLALLPPQTAISYGEQVHVQGILESPQAFLGDAGNIFDYPGYLRVQGVSMMLMQAQVQSSGAAAPSVQGALFSLKHLFDASLERLLPEPDVSLLEGILLGQRRGLPKELTEAFVVAGLIHIVILSGYSMSVVSEGVLRGLSFLPRKIQYVLGALLMVLFVMMTGAAATTVRACAMAIVALVARYFHRSAVALRSLAAVAAAMVLWNPPILLSDASFIVSVFATFGLIVFAPSIEHLLHFLPTPASLRSIITSTISVQLFALPALLYFTGNISFLSVPANVLVLPLLPLVMIAGLIAGLLGFIGPAVAFVPAAVADLLLKYILLVVAMVHLAPFAATTVYAFPLWAVFVIYIPLTALALHLYSEEKVSAQE